MISKLLNRQSEFRDNFHETIFLNGGIADIEKKIADIDSQLLFLKDDDPKRKDLLRRRLGLNGEKNVCYQLKSFNLGCYVIHDIHLDGKTDRTDDNAQIDFLVFTRGYIYIIECKTPAQPIKIDTDGSFIWGSKKVLSPINQVNIQKNKLEKIWRKKHPIASRFLVNSFKRKWYKTLVVIGNPEAQVDLSDAPDEVRSCIIRVDGLIDYIERDFARYKKTEPLSSKKLTKSIAESFLSSDYTFFSDDAEIRKNAYHAGQSIESIAKEQLEKEKHLREELKKVIRPNGDYVFTQRDIELILLRWPKTLSDIKTILPDHNDDDLLKAVNLVKQSGL